MSAPLETEILLVSAFTIDGQGGNLAGVVLDADRFTDGQKQAIAAAAGLSETAFVSRSSVATLKLDFFTPRRRIAHCGHATIATFGYLNSIGRLPDGLHTKETVDGLRQVSVQGGCAAMQQRQPVFDAVDDHAVLAALGVTADEVDVRFGPLRIDTGNGFVLVGLKHAASLATLAPDFQALEAISEALDLVGFYVFTTEAGPYDATARMFAPRYGIPEEAATGMAAGPLGAYLHRASRQTRFAVEQGRYMSPASPSRLDVALNTAAGTISDLTVSGAATLQASRTVRWAAAA